METREKQNLLTMIIIVAFLAIALIVGFIIYPEIKESNKSNSLNSQSTKQTENTSTSSTQTTSTINTETTKTESTNTGSTNGYIGEEEKNNGETESTSLTKEEKAIELTKKEWGEDDKNVTYNVEQKEDNIYYVAVRLNDQVQKWYEVDTEKWTIQEY